MTRILEPLKRAVLVATGLVLLFFAMRGLDGALVILLLVKSGVPVAIDLPRLALQLVLIAGTLTLGAWLVRAR